jgi:hypothetical protein
MGGVSQNVMSIDSEALSAILSIHVGQYGCHSFRKTFWQIFCINIHHNFAKGMLIKNNIL